MPRALLGDEWLRGFGGVSLQTKEVFSLEEPRPLVGVLHYLALCVHIYKVIAWSSFSLILPWYPFILLVPALSLIHI